MPYPALLLCLFLLACMSKIMHDSAISAETSAQTGNQTMTPKPKSINGCESVIYNRPGQPADYAYACPGRSTEDWVVVLHGHGSHGDQLFTREDIKTIWLPRLQEMGVSILAPNLRDNAWMNPEAVSDLHYLLQLMRQKYGAKRFFFMAGSMGGTGALIYAIRHPQEVSAVWAGCPATDLPSYLQWLEGKGGVLGEIRAAIIKGYTLPGKNPQELLQENSALQNCGRLTMPVFIQHGTADATIPFEQTKQLQDRVQGQANIRIEAMQHGGHEAPIRQTAQLKWLQEQIARP